VLRIKFIRRPSFVAIAHRDAPPTDVTQERVERRELVFDAITCKNVKILEEHRDDFLRAQEQFQIQPIAIAALKGRHLELFSTLSTCSPSAGVQLGGGLFNGPGGPPGPAVPLSSVEPRVMQQSDSSADI
jgi:hypothetical protein